MGSWNNTCGLSNLPIHDGESVYVFPIREEDLSGYRSHCYANALYDPVLTPFEAEYNDYGGGEECTGIALPLIINALRDQMIELEQGENQYHDIPVIKADFNIDKFFDAVHENRMFVKGWRAGNRPVYFTMVRKDVADRMWNDWTFDMWKGKEGAVPDGFESDQYYVKNVTYARLAELIPKFVDDCIAKYKSNPEIYDRFFSAGLMPSQDSLLSRTFGMLTDSQHHWDLLHFNGFVCRALADNDRLALIEIHRVALVGIMVNHIMEVTRKIWLPAMHMGSQSEEYDVYLMMNKVTNDVIAARKAYYHEANSDDD